MQKRYCKCGWSVWVNYLALPRALRIKPVFSSDGEAQGDVLDACPRCGRRLNIDDMA